MNQNHAEDADDLVFPSVSRTPQAAEHHMMLVT
jgi:hypothetical protein